MQRSLLLDTVSIKAPENILGTKVSAHCRVTFDVCSQSPRRLAQQVVLVRLESNRIYFFEMNRGHADGDDLLAQVIGLLGTVEDIGSPATALENQISDRLGCSIRFLNSFPGDIENWPFALWRRFRMIDLVLEQPGCLSHEIGERIATEETNLRSSLNSQVNNLLAQADPYLLGAANFPGVSWQRQFNYLLAEDELVRRNRRQAIELFPIIIAEILSAPDKASIWSQVSAAVDLGRPLVECIVKYFDCRPMAVRALRGIKGEDVGEEWPGSVRQLLHLLSSLPAEYLPRAREQWKSFTVTVNYLSRATGMPPTSLSIGMLLETAARQGWRLETNNQASLADRVRALESLAHDLADALAIYARVHGQQPSPDRGQFITIANRAIVMLGMKRVQRLANRWMTAKRESERELSEARGAKNFPVLLEQAFEAGAWTIVQLRNPAELSEESRRLRHCVDTYAGSCLKGNSVILSVRNRQGCSFSTVELAIKDKATSFPAVELIQHKALGNQSPSSSEVEAVQHLLHYCASPAFAPRLKAFCFSRRVAKLGKGALNDYQRASRLIAFLEQTEPQRICFQSLLDSTTRPVK